MATAAQVVTPASFRKLARPLLGLPVSRVWQSFEWTLFLELGRLAWESSRLKRARKRGSWKGQASVMLDFGWRIEREDGIVADLRSGRAVVTRALRSLRGRRVEGVAVEGRLPELSMRLSGGLWVRSLTVVAEQTEWAVFLERRPERSVWLAARGRDVIQEVGF